MINILNPYDEGALILALEQKDLNPKVKVSVVAMDTEGNSSDLLKKGLNLGADCSILFKKEQQDAIRFDEDTYYWSQGLATIDWQILLVGANKIDTLEDEFGIYLGEYLNLPVVSGVVDLQILPDKKARCWRKLEKGNREIVECDLPIVLTVDQISKVRYPTLRKIAASEENRILNLSREKEQKKRVEKKVILLKYQPPRARVKKGLFEINSNLSVSDRLTQLFGGGISEKKKGSADELNGSPGELAQKVLDCLIKKEVI